jgi:uncharacterized membrane-anchored protein YitT (DUF2179 family)
MSDPQPKQTSVNFFADGVPVDENYKRRGPAAEPGVKPIFSIEGLRGVSTRTAIIVKYISFFLTCVVAVAINAWAFSIAPLGDAKTFMFVSVAIVAGTAVVASWFNPQSRDEIVRQARDFMTWAIAGGTVIAVLYRGSISWLGGGRTNNGDFLVNLTANALPYLWYFNVVATSVAFVVIQARRRYLERSTLDDQEAVGRWTRQDHLQR